MKNAGVPVEANVAAIFAPTFPLFPTPVTIIFKYGNQIALANTERTQFKQTWREGEKVGKVSLLRDIDYTNVHSGHERILNNLAITRSGKNAITNFERALNEYKNNLIDRYSLYSSNHKELVEKFNKISFSTMTNVIKVFSTTEI